MSVSVSKRQYKNFGNCIFLDNGVITLGATVDVGPRIIYFSLNGKENVLFEDTERRFTEPAGEYGCWVAYGGHRIWCAPEVNPETYYPDNGIVSYSINENELILKPPVTPFGKEFTIIVEMDDTAPVVKLTHKIKNISEDDAEFAPWSVTSLSDGGVCMIPLNTDKRGYLPNRVMSLWDYSDIYDSRFRMSNSEVRIRQDCFIRKAFKAGFNLEDGFAAYAVKDQIFAKCIPEYKDVCYPDYSCNFEVYTNNLFLECELLGEKRRYACNEEAVISEQWCLLDNFGNAEPSDMMDDIGCRIKKLIN
ncbi:MAG: hypothetical protein SOZ56_11515 [Oscillospiraceae bacterium]|nr:hypothetical protein [Oscillospiraceae bacterium]